MTEVAVKNKFENFKRYIIHFMRHHLMGVMHNVASDLVINVTDKDILLNIAKLTGSSKIFIDLGTGSNSGACILNIGVLDGTLNITNAANNCNIVINIDNVTTNGVVYFNKDNEVSLGQFDNANILINIKGCSLDYSGAIVRFGDGTYGDTQPSNIVLNYNILAADVSPVSFLGLVSTIVSTIVISGYVSGRPITSTGNTALYTQFTLKNLTYNIIGAGNIFSGMQSISGDYVNIAGVYTNVTPVIGNVELHGDTIVIFTTI